MKTKLNIDLKWVIIGVVIIFLFFGGGFGLISHKLNKTQNSLLEQKNLTEALRDSIKTTLNKYGEVVSEKRTLQASLKTLNEQNLKLNQSQKELIDRVKEIQKDNQVISAALIETEAKLDSALFANSDVDINERDSSITFNEENDTISFNLTVLNTIPALSSKKPSLLFNKLSIPNKQFIEFHWENDKKYEQKPVSFSISNSNPIFKTHNIESYTIPEINKEAIKPTGWEKIKHFIGDRKSEFIIGAITGSIGIYIGATQF